MDLLMNLGWYSIPFLFVLTILVFVHELGHYLVAKYNGVGVDVFSIGFGPEIVGWNDKSGTRWKISCVPLGGYIKMVGDADAASTPDTKKLQKMDEEAKKRSLHYKTVWQRIAVTAAGPVANYLFAIVIFSILFATVGQRYVLPVVQTIQKESAAEQAGFQVGDKLKAINGVPLKRFEELQLFIQEHPAETLQVDVERGGDSLILSVAPKLSTTTDIFGRVHTTGLLGVGGNEIGHIHYSWATCWWHATTEVLSLSWQTVKALGHIIIGVKSPENLGGVLRMAQMSAEVAQSGIVALIWFMALLSVNLGLINLFPIPMLDGGHLLFYFCEVVRGKPLSDAVQEWGFRIGLVVVVGLMLLATGNDLIHIFFK